MLYLENSLATDAFTPARLALLGHLASQAAISIENARLYADVQRAEAALRQANDELEQRVEERTRELKQAQAQLVDTARAAGMAEVASNVLHNVGNVLTSAVINLQMMRQAVDASRLGRLKQVAALLEEHREDLADFLTRDPRGTHLPDYLSALADELLREQAALQESLEAMGQHIEHIRAIVQVQQNYARTHAHHRGVRPGPAHRGRPAHPAGRARSATASPSPGSSPRCPRCRWTSTRCCRSSSTSSATPRTPWTTLPEGQRHLRVRLDGARGSVARIQVVDNGMGIAPELRERLFSHGFTTRKERPRPGPALQRAGGADAGRAPHAGERGAGQGRHGHAGAPVSRSL